MPTLPACGLLVQGCGRVVEGERHVPGAGEERAEQQPGDRPLSRHVGHRPVQRRARRAAGSMAREAGLAAAAEARGVRLGGGRGLAAATIC